jgi:hypothetical protein
MQPNKFGGGSVTSPTSAYSGTNYGGFPANFSNKTTSEMVKSTIHENSKPPETNFGYPMQAP